MSSRFLNWFPHLCFALALNACGNPSANIKNSSPSEHAADTAAGPVQLQSSQGLCLDTAYDASSAGTPVQLWSCDGLSNQTWTYSNGALSVFGNMCLTSGTSPLQIQPCNPGNGAQQFTLSNGQLTSNGQCLDVAGEQAAAGAGVQLAACNNGATQAWNVSGGDSAANGGNANAGTAPPGGTSTGSTGGSPAPVGNSRTVNVVNHCSETLYAGVFYQSGTPSLPNNGGWALAPGASSTVTLPTPWSGRFWARTGCNFNAAGQGSCLTGDCGGQLQCGSTTAQPASLAEFTFGGWQGMDFYDVSMVEGFNVPIDIQPVPGTFTNNNSGSPYSCGTPSCTPNLLSTCPAALQHQVNGQEVACYNSCFAVGGDQFCCAGAFNTAQACVPNGYSEFFKAACPTAYSFPKDDPTSTFTCVASAYQITFCP